MHPTLVRTAVLAAGTALAMSGLAAVTTTPASAADDRPVDIVRLTNNHMLVSHRAEPYYVTLSRTISGPGVTSFRVTAGVYRGTKRLATVTFGTDPKFPGSAKVPYRRSWGNGTFRVANVRITGVRDDGTTFGPYADSTVAGGITTVTWASRGGLSPKVLRARSITFTVLAQSYGPDGWRAYPGRRVVIERKKAGTWRRVARVRLNKAGKARATVRAKHRYRYGLVTPRHRGVERIHSRSTVRM